MESNRKRRYRTEIKTRRFNNGVDSEIKKNKICEHLYHMNDHRNDDDKVESEKTQEAINFTCENLATNSIEIKPISNGFKNEPEPVILNNKTRTAKQKLREWAINCNIDLSSVTKLLKIINNHYDPDLPLDARTLLSTPRNISGAIKKMGANNGLNSEQEI